MPSVPHLDLVPTTAAPALTEQATELAAPSTGQRIARLDWAVAGLLLLLALVFQAPGVLPGRVAAPMDQLLTFAPWHSSHPVTPAIRGGDLFLQQLPWRHWMQQELAAGRFPLWASAPAGGMPLFASMQPGVLSPIHLLWILLPVGLGLGWIMALKLWLAGLGMWGFLRALGLHPAAVLLAAFSFEFSTSMINWLPWNISEVYLLLPWLAWTTYSWCITARRPALIGLTGVVASSLWAGHPETMFITGVMTAVWAAGLILTSPLRQWRRQIAGLVMAVALGLALGAVQLLPFLQVLPLTAADRATQQASTAIQHLEPEHLQDWLLPRQWSYYPDAVLAPDTTGFTEANGYIGLVALLGVGLAGWAALRRQLALRLAVPWIIICGLALLVTYDGGPGYLIRQLPGFNQSINVRWVMGLAAGLTVLSAFGWDWLARRAAAGAGLNSRLGGAGLLLLAEGVLLGGLHWAGLLPLPSPMDQAGPWSIENDSYRLYWALWAVGVGLTALGLTALWRMGRRGQLWAPALLAVVVLADLWRLVLPINGSAPATDYFPETPFLRQLRDLVPSPERFLVEGEALPANVGLVYGLRDWRVQDPMISRRTERVAFALSPTTADSVWAQYNMFMHDIHWPIATLLGIRYFVLPVPAAPGDFGEAADNPPPISRLAYKDGLSLWRVEEVPGFAYLSTNVQALPNPSSALAALKQITGTDARAAKALVEATPATVAAIHPVGAGAPAGQVTVQEYLPGHIRLAVQTAQPSLLVVNESWYPGWHAQLNGQTVTILHANYLSQGVIVPPGNSQIVLEYMPDAVLDGALISGVALLALLVFALWAYRVRLPRHPATSN